MRHKIFSVVFVFALFISLILPPNSMALFGVFEGQHKTVKAKNGEVTIPLNKVNDGKAHYFSFEEQGKEIHFFVLKSRDGVIRAAFDACDVCFPAKKGYSQEGDFMICNNCGRKFHATRINEVQGGCNPAPLNRIIKGDFLVIQAVDILTGARYF